MNATSWGRSRRLDEVGRTANAVFVGTGQLPMSLRGRRSVPSALARAEDLVLVTIAELCLAVSGGEREGDVDAFVRRPTTEFGGHLPVIARLIKADLGLGPSLPKTLPGPTIARRRPAAGSPALSLKGLKSLSGERALLSGGKKAWIKSG